MPSAGPASPRHLPDLTFTGRCDLSLERAVVPYLGTEERGLPGGRASDLGVGVVLRGPEGGRAQLLDLGSGAVREGFLGTPLVVFGWIFSRPFRELEAATRDFRQGGAGAREGDAPAGAPPGIQGAAGRILDQLGYTPLTRPVFLRIGFRDVAMDLDPHEGTAVRLVVPGAGVARVHLDYDRGVLVVRTGRPAPPTLLRDALADAFPGLPLYQLLNPAGAGTSELQLHLGVLDTLEELRGQMRGVRRGLLHLLARFDPPRHRAALEAATGFGERDLLNLVGKGPTRTAERVASRTPPTGVSSGEPAGERVRLPREGLHATPLHSGRVH